jgi:hypothetical protein
MIAKVRVRRQAKGKQDRQRVKGKRKADAGYILYVIKVMNE